MRSKRPPCISYNSTQSMIIYGICKYWTHFLGVSASGSTKYGICMLKLIFHLSSSCLLTKPIHFLGNSLMKPQIIPIEIIPLRIKFLTSSNECYDETQSTVYLHQNPYFVTYLLVKYFNGAESTVKFVGRLWVQRHLFKFNLKEVGWTFLRMFWRQHGN